MKTKEEVIKEKWIEIIGEENFKKLTIYENGYSKSNCLLFITKFQQEKYFDSVLSIPKGIPKKYQPNGSDFIYRPKSLQGIDDNFGWISINSEKDLPGEDLDVHIVFKKDGGNFQTFGVWDKRLNSFWSGAMKIDIPTHYQPIVKPLKPLHK